jgi:hypothetical protein
VSYLVLGAVNTASTTTTLKSAVNGSVLQITNTNAAGGTSARGLAITVPAGRAPLLVNSSAGKAPNLNADKLDGLDQAAFLRSTGKAADADKLDGVDSTAFARRLWAVVKDDGTLLRGSGATSVIVGGGGYFVRFDTDVSNCAYLATVGQANLAYFDRGEAQAFHSTGAGDATHDVYVAFSDKDTGALSRGFSLVVLC